MVSAVVVGHPCIRKRSTRAVRGDCESGVSTNVRCSRLSGNSGVDQHCHGRPCTTCRARKEADERMKKRAAKPKTKKPTCAAAFPKGVSKPAQRALASVGVFSVDQTARFSEKELAALHGMGPKALGLIKAALRERGKSFAKE